MCGGGRYNIRQSVLSQPLPPPCFEAMGKYQSLFSSHMSLWCHMSGGVRNVWGCQRCVVITAEGGLAAEPLLALPSREVNEPQGTQTSYLPIFTSKQGTRSRSHSEYSAGSPGASAALPPRLDSFTIIFPFWVGGCSSTSSHRTG